MRMAHLSDLHFGKHDEALAPTLAPELEAQKLDLIVISGDFTQDGTEDEFKIAREFIDTLHAPVFAVPGTRLTACARSRPTGRSSSSSKVTVEAPVPVSEISACRPVTTISSVTSPTSSVTSDGVVCAAEILTSATALLKPSSS